MLGKNGVVVLIVLATMITMIILAIVIQNGETNEKSMQFKCIEKTMNKDSCIIK